MLLPRSLLLKYYSFFLPLKTRPAPAGILPDASLYLHFTTKRELTPEARRPCLTRRGVDFIRRQIFSSTFNKKRAFADGEHIQIRKS
jgi:hypothetical protein